MYDYRARVVKVVDGDTLNLSVDPGLDLRDSLIVRLYGINAPEMSTADGQAAKAFVEQWLAAYAGSETDLMYGADGSTQKVTHVVVGIRTIKDRREKYGRYLAVIYPPADPSGETLNDALVRTGHAVPYMVGK